MRQKRKKELSASMGVFTSLGVICLFILLYTTEDCDECYSIPAMMIKLTLSGGVIMIGSVILSVLTFRNERRMLPIASQPILDTNEATDGVVFAGYGIVTADPQKLLRSPYKDIPCVYFHSVLEKEVGSGRRKRWDVVENKSAFIPFFIQDDRGKIGVDIASLDSDLSGYAMAFDDKHIPDPGRTEVDCENVLKGDVFTETKKVALIFSDKTRYRRSEFVLRPDTKMFVYGMIGEREGKLTVHETKEYPLIISKKTREEYVKGPRAVSDLAYMAYIFVALGYSVSLFSLDYFFSWPLVSLISFWAIGGSIILFPSLFAMYNRIVTLQKRAQSSFADIDGELKRRTDLLPNIIEIVRGYTGHEEDIQYIIAESRSRIGMTKETPQKIKFTIPTLAAAIEAYPALKANEQFRSAMHIFIDTEERIAYTREFYNKTVREYNELITVFPFVAIAVLCGFRQMDFISILPETPPPYGG